MSYGQGDSVPIPTSDETAEARKAGNEIVACSALKIGPLIYMKFGFRNGHMSTAILGDAAECLILSVLKAVVPEHERVAAAPSKVGEYGLEVQAGHMSA